MADTLQVESRSTRGKRNSKRLRAGGKVPAVLYGHGEEAVSLAVGSDQILAAVRHGSRVVQLKGAVSDSALIRELQYDTYGVRIVHIDFARVSADERVHVKVPLELRGQAIGVKEGGIIELLIHEVEIECPVSTMPEKLVINVTTLKLEGAITVGEVPLPEGVKMLSSPDEIAVHCVKPAAEEDDAGAGGTAEPEVIGRKEKDGEAEEE